LDRDGINGIISEYIHGLIRIYNICGVKDERAWDLFHDIMFFDPVTTHNFSQFQMMRTYCRSGSLPFRVWWAAFRSYMRRMFDKTRDRRINWRWDNPGACGDQVDCSNQWTTSSGMVKCSGERFSWYGSDDLRATIEPPSCQQYKPGDFLAVGPLNWNEMFHEDDDDDNWADPGGPSCGRSCPGHGNDNHNAESEEDSEGAEQGVGKGKGTKHGKGTWKGKGKGNGKGKCIVK
jgi:hypothetical protein